MEAAAAALRPPDGPPRRIAGVLPDAMLLAYQEDLAAAGVQDEPLGRRVSTARWQRVRTFGATLDQQGLPDRFGFMWYRSEFQVKDPRAESVYLHFNAVDGVSSVWINGQAVTVTAGNAKTSPATFPALSPFIVEVTELLERGANRVAILVDHRTLRELSLGGIVAPIYVLEQKP